MFSKLCAPARLYLALSALSLFIMFMMNVGSENIYCLGSTYCAVESVTAIFIMKIIYIAFWTWVLNLICKSNYPVIAWFLVLIPIVIFFILLTFMVMSMPQI
jgi:hypothetical protein